MSVPSPNTFKEFKAEIELRPSSDHAPWLGRAAQDLLFLDRDGINRIHFKCQHQIQVSATHYMERTKLTIRNITFKMAFKGITELMGFSSPT